MKGSLGTVVFVVLAAAAARADTVVLTDGREIHGKASFEGEKVVIRADHGETSFSRDAVESVRYEAEAKSDDDAEQKKRDETKKAEQERPRELSKADLDAIMEALSGKKKFERLPESDALHWEKDGAVATRLASEAKKIVLTFSVLGELGTGHC
jgi:hypothetical protein